jgi:signal transduction histidine kinase
MAILNLSLNARDAMPEGGVLAISARGETVGPGHPLKLKPGRYILLSIADTGAGMDEATMAEPIKPFFSTKGVGQTRYGDDGRTASTCKHGFDRKCRACRRSGGGWASNRPRPSCRR